jgi:DNA-binding CsgD family transcriptional regulator
VNIWSLVGRGLIGLLATAWIFNVVMVAVFAVPDRYSGAGSILMSLLIFAGGLLPIAIFAYLFREHLPALSPRSHVASGISSKSEPATLLEALSDRELEVLALVARGRSNKEIAQELTITVGTVKTHTNNINRKLGTRTRTQAIAAAQSLGLL